MVNKLEGTRAWEEIDERLHLHTDHSATYCTSLPKILLCENTTFYLSQSHHTKNEVEFLFV
jgi:hypothetical protein